MSVTATLSGAITVVDSSSGAQPFTKQLSNLAFIGNVSDIASSALIGTSPTTITLPVSPTQFVYIKNLSAAQTVTVSWTPTSGVLAVVQTLEAGGALLAVNISTGAGITTLSATAGIANTPIEYILLG